MNGPQNHSGLGKRKITKAHMKNLTLVTQSNAELLWLIPSLQWKDTHLKFSVAVTPLDGTRNSHHLPLPCCSPAQSGCPLLRPAGQMEHQKLMRSVHAGMG
jgi:hypothetical protein